MSKQSKKIVGVISFMNAAGAQEALLRLGRQLRQRGYDMEVWFLYEEDPIHANEPSVRTFVRKPKLSPLEYVSVFFELVGALRKERPDVVIGFLPLGNVFGMLAAYLAGVPFRIASQRAPGPTFGKVMRIMDRHLGASAVYDRIVCVSNAVKASFANYPEAYRRKLSVVHNGIEWTPSSLDKAAARRSLGLPQDRFIFAAIGRMKTQKNYPFMLEVMSRVENAVLVVVGDGLLRPELEARAAALGIGDRVMFLGALGRSSVRDFMRAADALIQTSLYEGQSNVVLEAMHAGLPMVISDIPEQRETIADDAAGQVGGLLAPLGDAQAWVEAMSRLRDDAALREELSRNAHAIVERHFTVQRMIDGFEAVIVSGPNRAA